ncbi:bifunctional phosphoribosyl-AMP cyclohydrolase/phosphoribosyl-ATP diphosphatase HisIE [Aliidiomarina halalkaliphila]|uniref:Histidine biosynthesis bifunctional protein HisIE n=1 Tax=Aliidiomarina halalkaliphila TaxID=2593535 RepID=A0A552X527_9GAMM|nr:bifunctional phosphoribosyl-AMP cyclohydrolase/phosphoribosyl-ATP diphosphatase HisIE [Aliidiomarina halalkaliphila]TRW50110.1 bifunctional phosphoribosyl-AMP cyclohydrolase/phosphoribosyl-ATP diphosphatase HisIE [Aliidiomarina halalkaliphila]
MNINADNVNKLAWEKMQGLIPCMVQDAESGRLLMQGYMNPEALQRTLDSGKITFYSRSKERQWTKGETTGHTLQLVSLTADCDQDAILALAHPQGPTCHLGNECCWEPEQQPIASELIELERTIAARKAALAEGNPGASYTATLLSDGIRRCAQKVGEEGVEVALAAVAQDDNALLNESADLLYHLLVVLHARDLTLTDVVNTLRERR